jgi:hypothetical protein
VACIAATDTSFLSLSPSLSYHPFDTSNDTMTGHVLSPISEDNGENNNDENTNLMKNNIEENYINDNKTVISRNNVNENDNYNEINNNNNNNNNNINNTNINNTNIKVYERVRLDVHIDPVEINAPQTVLIGEKSVF